MNDKVDYDIRQSLDKILFCMRRNEDQNIGTGTTFAGINGGHVEHCPKILR